MTEEVIYDIEELGANIGPYQTEGFKELEFTIDEVEYPDKVSAAIRFRNGNIVMLYSGEYDLDGNYSPYRNGLQIVMGFDYYRDGDTMNKSISNDRVLFYLTMVGSSE